MTDNKEFDLTLLDLTYRYRFKPKPHQQFTPELVKEMVVWLQDETVGRVGLLGARDIIFLDVNAEANPEYLENYESRREGFSAYLFFEHHSDMLRFKLTWG